MNVSDIIALSIGAVIGIIIIVYLCKNQKDKVIEWLKYAVAEAERLLGDGTGQLKLRLVYDWFVQKFPAVAAVVPFKVFSAWTDVALSTMKHWLEVGNPIGDYIMEAKQNENNKEKLP